MPARRTRRPRCRSGRGRATARPPSLLRPRLPRPRRAPLRRLRTGAARPLPADQLQQRLARPLAAPALLGAQPAVLVMLGVALALRRTGPACRQAGLERGALRRPVRIGLAAED